MKRLTICILVLVVAVVLVAGCNKANLETLQPEILESTISPAKSITLAEEFLGIHDESFFIDLYYNVAILALPRPEEADINYKYTGFINTNLILSDNLYNFFVQLLKMKKSILMKKAINILYQ